MLLLPARRRRRVVAVAGVDVVGAAPVVIGRAEPAADGVVAAGVGEGVVAVAEA
jgi:hypothetical protein